MLFSSLIAASIERSLADSQSFPLETQLPANVVHRIEAGHLRGFNDVVFVTVKPGGRVVTLEVAGQTDYNAEFLTLPASSTHVGVKTEVDLVFRKPWRLKQSKARQFTSQELVTLPQSGQYFAIGKFALERILPVPSSAGASNPEFSRLIGVPVTRVQAASAQDFAVLGMWSCEDYVNGVFKDLDQRSLLVSLVSSADPSNAEAVIACTDFLLRVQLAGLDGDAVKRARDLAKKMAERVSDPYPRARMFAVAFRLGEEAVFDQMIYEFGRASDEQSSRMDSEESFAFMSQLPPYAPGLTPDEITKRDTVTRQMRLLQTFDLTPSVALKMYIVRTLGKAQSPEVDRGMKRLIESFGVSEQFDRLLIARLATYFDQPDRLVASTKTELEEHKAYWVERFGGK